MELTNAAPAETVLKLNIRMDKLASMVRDIQAQVAAVQSSGVAFEQVYRTVHSVIGPCKHRHHIAAYAACRAVGSITPREFAARYKVRKQTAYAIAKLVKSWDAQDVVDVANLIQGLDDV